MHACVIDGLTCSAQVAHFCLKDAEKIPPMGKKFLAEVVEMTSYLYANTNAGQETAYLLLRKVRAAAAAAAAHHGFLQISTSLLGFTLPKHGPPQQLAAVHAVR